MRSSKASLFLMELMISILFFSLSGAVCILLFVKAHTLNQTTEDKSNATIIAQNISEYFHYAEGDKAKILSYYTEYEESDEAILLYFTKHGTYSSQTDAYYVAILSFGQESNYRTLDINIHCMDNNETLYTSSLKKYIQATL